MSQDEADVFQLVIKHMERYGTETSAVRRRHFEDKVVDFGSNKASWMAKTTHLFRVAGDSRYGMTMGGFFVCRMLKDCARWELQDACKAKKSSKARVKGLMEVSRVVRGLLIVLRRLVSSDLHAWRSSATSSAVLVGCRYADCLRMGNLDSHFFDELLKMLHSYDSVVATHAGSQVGACLRELLVHPTYRRMVSADTSSSLIELCLWILSEASDPSKKRKRRVSDKDPYVAAEALGLDPDPMHCAEVLHLVLAAKDFIVSDPFTVLSSVLSVFGNRAKQVEFGVDWTSRTGVDFASSEEELLKIVAGFANSLRKGIVPLIRRHASEVEDVLRTGEPLKAFSRIVDLLSSSLRVSSTHSACLKALKALICAFGEWSDFFQYATICEVDSVLISEPLILSQVMSPKYLDEAESEVKYSTTVLQDTRPSALRVELTDDNSLVHVEFEDVDMKWAELTSVGKLQFSLAAELLWRRDETLEQIESLSEMSLKNLMLIEACANRCDSRTLRAISQDVAPRLALELEKRKLELSFRAGQKEDVDINAVWLLKCAKAVCSESSESLKKALCELILPSVLQAERDAKKSAISRRIKLRIARCLCCDALREAGPPSQLFEYTALFPFSERLRSVQINPSCSRTFPLSAMRLATAALLNADVSAGVCETLCDNVRVAFNAELNASLKRAWSWSAFMRPNSCEPHRWLLVWTASWLTEIVAHNPYLLRRKSVMECLSESIEACVVLALRDKNVHEFDDAVEESFVELSRSVVHDALTNVVRTLKRAINVENALPPWELLEGALRVFVLVRDLSVKLSVKFNVETFSCPRAISLLKILLDMLKLDSLFALDAQARLEVALGICRCRSLGVMLLCLMNSSSYMSSAPLGEWTFSSELSFALEAEPSAEMKEVLAGMKKVVKRELRYMGDQSDLESVMAEQAPAGPRPGTEVDLEKMLSKKRKRERHHDPTNAFDEEFAEVYNKRKPAKISPTADETPSSRGGQKPVGYELWGAEEENPTKDVHVASLLRCRFLCSKNRHEHLTRVSESFEGTVDALVHRCYPMSIPSELLRVFVDSAACLASDLKHEELDELVFLGFHMALKLADTFQQHASALELSVSAMCKLCGLLKSLPEAFKDRHSLEAFEDVLTCKLIFTKPKRCGNLGGSTKVFAVRTATPRGACLPVSARVAAVELCWLCLKSAPFEFRVRQQLQGVIWASLDDHDDCVRAKGAELCEADPSSSFVELASTFHTVLRFGRPVPGMPVFDRSVDGACVEPPQARVEADDATFDDGHRRAVLIKAMVELTRSDSRLLKMTLFRLTVFDSSPQVRGGEELDLVARKCADVLAEDAGYEDSFSLLTCNLTFLVWNVPESVFFDLPIGRFSDDASESFVEDSAFELVPACLCRGFDFESLCNALSTEGETDARIASRHSGSIFAVLLTLAQCSELDDSSSSWIGHSTFAQLVNNAVSKLHELQVMTTEPGADPTKVGNLFSAVACAKFPNSQATGFVRKLFSLSTHASPFFPFQLVEEKTTADVLARLSAPDLLATLDLGDVLVFFSFVLHRQAVSKPDRVRAVSSARHVLKALGFRAADDASVLGRFIEFACSASKAFVETRTASDEIASHALSECIPEAKKGSVSLERLLYWTRACTRLPKTSKLVEETVPTKFLAERHQVERFSRLKRPQNVYDASELFVCLMREKPRDVDALHAELHNVHELARVGGFHDPPDAFVRACADAAAMGTSKLSMLAAKHVSEFVRPSVVAACAAMPSPRARNVLASTSSQESPSSVVSESLDEQLFEVASNAMCRLYALTSEDVPFEVRFAASSVLRACVSSACGSSVVDAMESSNVRNALRSLRKNVLNGALPFAEVSGEPPDLISKNALAKVRPSHLNSIKSKTSGALKAKTRWVSLSQAHSPASQTHINECSGVEVDVKVSVCLAAFHDDIWSIDVFDVWIRTLTDALCRDHESGAKDSLLSLLGPVCALDTRFATEMLPDLIYASLINDSSDSALKISKQIGAVFAAVFADDPPNQDIVRSLVRTLDHLRACSVKKWLYRKEDVERGGDLVGSKERYHSIMLRDLKPEDVCRVALKVGMPSSALMHAEIFALSKRVDSSSSLAEVIRRNHKLCGNALVAAHRALNDRAGATGVSVFAEEPSLRTLLERYRFEGDWVKTVQATDALNKWSDSRAEVALREVGLSNLAHQLKLNEKSFEYAWRAGDLSNGAYAFDSFNCAVFKCLKAAHERRGEVIVSTARAALAGIVESVYDGRSLANERNRIRSLDLLCSLGEDFSFLPDLSNETSDLVLSVASASAKTLESLNLDVYRRNIGKISLKRVSTCRRDTVMALSLLESIPPSFYEKVDTDDGVEFRLEKARVFWAAGDDETANSLVRSVVHKLKSLGSGRLSKVLVEQAEVAGASSGRAKGDLKIEQVYRDAIANCPIVDTAQKAQAHAGLARYLDASLRSATRRLESSTFKAFEANLKLRKERLRLLERQFQETQDAEVGRAHSVLATETSSDEREIADLKKSKEQYAKSCVDHYAKSLRHFHELSAVDSLRVAFRFVVLWFQTDVEHLEHALRHVPTKALLPVVRQLCSRIDHTKAVAEYVLKMACEHPLDVVPHLLSLIHSRFKNPEDSLKPHNDEASDPKSLAAKRLMSGVKSKSPELMGVCSKTEHLHLALVELALYEVPSKQRSKISCSSCGAFAHHADRFNAMTNINVRCPTTSQIMSSFDSHFVIAPQGITRPKILKISNADGVDAKVLVKGQDDLRQDAVMEQMFEVFNAFLSEQADSSEEDALRLRTYSVVPLTTNAGVLGWVENTVAFHRYLLGSSSRGASEFDSGAHGRHGRYAKHLLSYHQAMTKFKNTQVRRAQKSNRYERVSISDEKLSAVYTEICERFPPTFRHFFVEHFWNPSEWYLRRRSYTNSVAVNSMVGFVAGIGDRHGQNILLDEKTAEVVHIDFGITFEQGKTLATPERVPFRLTRDVVDGFGVSGVRGLFSHSCRRSLGVLRNNADSLLAVCEVLVHDPLVRWRASEHKRSRAQRETNTSRSEDEDVEARRVLSVMRNKLSGFVGIDLASRGDLEAMSVADQVECVVSAASDPKRLSRMYYGWAPFV